MHEIQRIDPGIASRGPGRRLRETRRVMRISSAEGGGSRGDPLELAYVVYLSGIADLSVACIMFAKLVQIAGSWE